MDLREATTWVLKEPSPAKWLRLADTYIQAYNRVPNQFVLPREHAALKPVIDAFALDTAAFSTYIRAVRDGSHGEQYDELHELYRTVSVRALQMQRRNRIRKAALLAVPAVEKTLGRVLRYDDEVVLAKFIEQRWAAMRMEAMATARASYKKARLPTEDRAEVLEQFWKELDSALEQGTVPLGADGEQWLDDVVNLLS